MKSYPSAEQVVQQLNRAISVNWCVTRNGVIDAQQELAAPMHTAVQPETVQTKGDDQSELGDCFVVVNSLGKCWDGAAWVNGWCMVLQFRRPDPAYELCQQAACEAKRLTGVAGVVCYIPPGTPASFRLVAFPDLSQVDLRDFALKPEVC